MDEDSDMDRIARRRALLVFALAIGMALSGCDEDNGLEPDPPADPLVISVAAPESLVRGIEVVYNDLLHSALERRQAYASLFDGAFAFHFQPGDIYSYGMPRAWDLEDEITASDSLFNALEVGTAHSVDLRIQWNPAVDLNPPEPGREGWKEVFATNVYLFVMMSAGYGLEVNGGQARFLAKPADGRWYLTAWTDLPRPRSQSAIEPSSWGTTKARFHPEPIEPFLLPGHAAPESLVASIVAIYNDLWQPASTRRAAWMNLLSYDFVFHFQPEDIANGLPESWGWFSEVQSHERMFRFQDQRDIHSLTLAVAMDPAVDLDPPEPGREGWKEVFCPSVHLRLMWNANDGLEVNGDQARFLVKPESGRWFIADWTDLPAPGTGPAVGNDTWGSTKSLFLRRSP